jgi:hypothetical protein
MRNSIVLVYNSFKDPLFQATLWLYLNEESHNNRFIFHLLTFEQEEYKIDPLERETIRMRLLEQNIYWYPLRWHSGNFKILKKFYDLSNAFLLVIKIKMRHNAKSMISLGTVAGSFAYILAKIFRLKNYIYQFERHSEFLADFGIWSKSSFSYKLLHRLESISGKGSEILATGTSHMISRLKSEGVKGEVFYLPSCVDDSKFEFNEESRKKIRQELQIENRRVLIYVGKFEGIYFSLDEMASFFFNWKNIDPSAFFIILTPHDKTEVITCLKKYEISDTQCFVSLVPHEEIPDYLSAADIGLVAVPSYPSQKFRSPIKVGEYLCCGLPYIVGNGISDDDSIAIDNEVGIVIESYDSDGIKKIQSTFKNIINKNRNEFRKVGVSYRGFSELKKTSHQIFDRLYEL